MTSYKTLCVLALVLLTGSPWAAETRVDPGFEPYKTIIDRRPFGPEPVNFNPDAPGSSSGGGVAAGQDPAAAEALQQQEEQKIIAAVRISALNVTPSGKVAVGFTDNSKQPAGTYYLKVGESRDGWTVKAADAREMKVTLEKDGVEATLALGEGSAGERGKGEKSSGETAGQIRDRLGRQNRAGLLRPAGAAPASLALTPDGGGSAFANLRARRARMEAERRAEAERQAAAAAQAKADREQAAAERERAAVEREQAAAERERQSQALMQQIQEELHRQREATKSRQQHAEAAASEAQANPEPTE